MTRDEIIALIKDNLTVSVSIGERVKVSLCWDDDFPGQAKVFSEDHDYLPGSDTYD